MTDNELKMLCDLYCIPSESNHEHDMIAYLKQMFKDRGCKVKNKNNNLYITKGQAKYYPCIAAHMDEVHSGRGKYTTFVSDDTIFGWSLTDKEQCGIGADDKNGIWVALRAVEELSSVKIALFVGEEIGCVGSSKAWMQFFNDCRYVLQVDRRNAGDLITNISGRMVSDAFMKDIQPIADEFGYEETYGMMTDVEELCEKGVGISCINMSCGYYNPHTEREITIISELENTLQFVLSICRRMTKRYEHNYESKSYFDSWRGRSSSHGFGSLFDDYYYDNKERRWKYKPLTEPKQIGEVIKQEPVCVDDNPSDENDCSDYFNYDDYCVVQDYLIDKYQYGGEMKSLQQEKMDFACHFNCSINDVTFAEAYDYAKQYLSF